MNEIYNKREWDEIKQLFKKRKEGRSAMNLDRFSQGLPDPQEEKPITECAGCSLEVYPKDDVYVVDGAILHADWECLYRYINPICITAEEVLGVEK